MRIILALTTLFSLTVLLSGVKADAETIPGEEAKRLEAFFRKTLDTKMPKDAKISVNGYQESPISGFKKGGFCDRGFR